MSESEYEQWDAFIDNCQYGSVFHKSYWSKALFSQNKSVTIDLIGCFNKENNLVAGSVIAWKLVFWKFKVCMVPYATPFYGMVVSDRKTEYVSKIESQRFAVIEALLGFIEKNYHSIIIIFPPDFVDIRVFNWRKYTTRVMFTYRGEIKNADEMVFLPSIRRRIKKAEKLEYRILRNKDKDHLVSVYHMINKSYERQLHGFDISLEQFVSLLTEETIGKQIEVFSIWTGNVPVASILMLIDGETAYYWMAGGDHTYFDTGLNQLLLSKAFETLSETTVKQIDMVGANTPSISNYKSGYNFSLQGYYHVSKYTTAMTRFLFSVKSIIETLKRK